MGTERCNEINLIQQTLAGDTSAFDPLVMMHRTTIYALVLSYIKNPADAEDLTQLVFIRAYERLATLRELDCFLAWLQQIAHNTCKDWLRRRGEPATSVEAVKDADFIETAPSAEDIVLKAEIETIVRKAIDGLKETDRKLMEARYIEGASYDELREESGLSYAAIANRLKRAKREVRRRVRQLLGGVAILPGRTFILGGMETMKLSAKAKLATAALAAVIGIGGGSVLYHHTSQLQPIVANEEEVSEARTAVVNSSTELSSTASATASDSSATNKTPILVLETSQIDSFEITVDDVTKTLQYQETLQYQDLDELPEELTEELTVLLHNRVEQHGLLRVGDRVSVDINVDGAVIVESEAGVILEGTAEDVLEEIDTLGEPLATLVRHALTKEHSSNVEVRLLYDEGLPESLKQKIARVATDKIAESTAISEDARPTPIQSQQESTVSVPEIESSPISPEPSRGATSLSDEAWTSFEKLLSELSDEEWANLERLLDTSSDGTPPQQDRQTPPNAERQPNIERMLDEPLTAPSEQQEIWRQQPDLPESNSNVPP